MSVKMRQEVERKIAAALVKSARAAGYTISVDNGEDETYKMSSAKAVLAAMFTTDEDRLFMWNPANGKCVGWVYFVYGNDGWDVISDYTTNLEPIMAEANKISKQYED